MKSKKQSVAMMILALVLCGVVAGGCVGTPNVQVTVLNAGHCVLLTPEQAPSAYALPSVKSVWQVTDVWLDEAHQIQMEVK
jgi:hypothetical protein